MRRCKNFLSAWTTFFAVVMDGISSTWKRDEKVKGLFFGNVSQRDHSVNASQKSFFNKLIKLILAFLASHQQGIFYIFCHNVFCCELLQLWIINK